MDIVYRPKSQCINKFRTVCLTFGRRKQDSFSLFHLFRTTTSASVSPTNDRGIVFIPTLDSHHYTDRKYELRGPFKNPRMFKAHNKQIRTLCFVTNSCIALSISPVLVYGTLAWARPVTADHCIRLQRVPMKFLSLAGYITRTRPDGQ